MGIFALIAFGTAFSVLAQAPHRAPRPVPPVGPLLNPPPNFSEWVTTFSYPQDRPDPKTGVPPSGLPPLSTTLTRKVITTKTGNIVHEETQDVAGRKSDRWQNGQTIFIKTVGQSAWGVLGQRAGKNNFANDPNLPLPASGFRDLDWISADAYAGSLKTDSGVFLVFIPPGSGTVDLTNPKAALAQLPTLFMVALIDYKTRLPVSVQGNGITRSYNFTAPPVSMQTLPPDLANQIKADQARVAKLFAVPSQ